MFILSIPCLVTDTRPVQIRSIISLLDRPKAAKFKLRPNMELMEKAAQDCVALSKQIQDQFGELKSFTMALAKATEDKLSRQ
jgi:hypothetical protein